MKTTVDLPDELLIEAKKHAAENRTTIRALMERGLRHELSREPQPGKVRHPVIRWVTVRGGLPKGLDIADRAQMVGRLMHDRS